MQLMKLQLACLNDEKLQHAFAESPTSMRRADVSMGDIAPLTRNSSTRHWNCSYPLQKHATNQLFTFRSNSGEPQAGA